MSTSGKTAYITDFDDTLVHTDAKVILIKKDGSRHEISPADYASYEPEPGDDFDFSEFEQLKNPRPVKRFAKLLKRVVNEKRADKVIVLTARGHTKPVKSFLTSIGITSGVTIAALASADPMKKANYIEKHIKDGYTRIAFVDDAPKNIRAVNSLKAKYPEVKLIVHQATEKDSSNASSPSEKDKSDKTAPKKRERRGMPKVPRGKYPERIRNPITGRDILFKSALKSPKDSKAYQAAMQFMNNKKK